MTSLHIARGDHTATLLSDGSVLVVGGYGTSGLFNNGALDSAELYQDSGLLGTLGTWKLVVGSLSTGRGDHTATLLQNGAVLVAGGVDASGNDIATAELYDPVTGAWSTTGNMITPRSYHTATLLSDGRVLMVGGTNQAIVEIASAEIYDPATGHFTAAGSLTTPRESHTATLLNDGTVLVAGGFNHGPGGTPVMLASAEIYHPVVQSAGTWTTTSSLSTPRYSHTATLLNDGTVLVVGGTTTGYSDISSAEIYHPTGTSAGTWTPTGALITARHNHTATLITTVGALHYGNVLVIGGTNTTTPSIASAEWYSNTWTQIPATGRVIHTATELTTGLNAGWVLVVGGNDTINGATNVLSSVDLLH